MRCRIPSSTSSIQQTKCLRLLRHRSHRPAQRIVYCRNCQSPQMPQSCHRSAAAAAPRAPRSRAVAFVSLISRSLASCVGRKSSVGTSGRTVVRMWLHVPNATRFFKHARRSGHLNTTALSSGESHTFTGTTSVATTDTPASKKMPP